MPQAVVYNLKDVQQSGLGQAEVRSLQLNLHLPHRRQEPNELDPLGHYLHLSPTLPRSQVLHYQEARIGRRASMKPGTVIGDTDVLASIFVFYYLRFIHLKD